MLRLRDRAPHGGGLWQFRRTLPDIAQRMADMHTPEEDAVNGYLPAVHTFGVCTSYVNRVSS